MPAERFAAKFAVGKQTDTASQLERLEARRIERSADLRADRRAHARLERLANRGRIDDGSKNGPAIPLAINSRTIALLSPEAPELVASAASIRTTVPDVTSAASRTLSARPVRGTCIFRWCFQKRLASSSASPGPLRRRRP